MSLLDDLLTDDVQQSLQEFDLTLTAELNTLWVLLGGILVFFMQTGFAMREVGAVSQENTQKVILKNILDASVGCVIWATCGYGLSMGTTEHQIYGQDHFFLTKDAFSDGTGNRYASWLFQWAFAATTASIVSGALSERITFTGYIVYVHCLLGIIYPLIVQLAWGNDGYMSSNLNSDDKKDYYAGCGVLDFAGSGVVHVTGGLMALIGCILIGPRDGFKENELKSNSYGPIFQTLGTLIVWFGWFGFTAGSTQGIVNMGQVAARTMVATSISAACSCLVSFVLGYAHDFYVTRKTEVSSLEHANNGALAGLVAISAACSVVELYAAAIIGCGAAVVYFTSSKLMVKLGVDDVVNAVPIHFFCGMYGVIMAALLATKGYYKDVYGIYEDSEKDCAGLFYGGGTNLLEANGSFLVACIIFTGFLSTIVFGSLRCLNLLRVNNEDEE